MPQADPPEPTPPAAFGYPGVRKLTGLSDSTLKRHVRDGTLRHRKVGRRVIFTFDDVQQFLDSYRRGGEA